MCNSPSLIKQKISPDFITPRTHTSIPRLNSKQIRLWSLKPTKNSIAVLWRFLESSKSSKLAAEPMASTLIPFTSATSVPLLNRLPCRFKGSWTRRKLCAMSTTDPSSDSFANKQDGLSEAKDQNDVIVQYVVLRRDLIETWPLGSVVTQGCHASVSAIWENKDDAFTVEYCSPDKIDSMHKVTLEVKGETQILNLVEKLKAGGISHRLWIEQPENIPTCLATRPYPKSLVSSYFKKLKLCK